MSRNTITLIFLFSLLLTLKATSKEEQKEKQDNIESAQNSKPSIRFSVSPKILEDNRIADEFTWVSVENTKHLILIHRRKGRIQRGNILLLHSQQENANHRKIISPLAKQLADLGWDIFIPNIALEDYPKKLTIKTNDQTSGTATSSSAEQAETASSSPSSTPEKNTKTLTHKNKSIFYFGKSDDYQNYYSMLCKSIWEKTEITNEQFIIVASQNAAYWGLNSLKKWNITIPIVFIQPKIPEGISDDLSKLFKQQTGPVLSFHLTEDRPDHFLKTFNKQLWKSKHLRLNKNALSSSKLHIENITIAKTITGWFENQQKQKQN